MLHWQERIERVKAVRYLLYQQRKELPCYWCGIYLEQDDATLEHLHPESKGGPTTVDNCVIACTNCNNKRGTLPVEEFRSSAWLKKKLEQLSREKQNRSIPENKTDSEIRELAASYLEGLDKNQLIAIIMGLAKQQTLDLFAHRKLRNETG